jgi:type IV secretion system protein VirB8
MNHDPNYFGRAASWAEAAQVEADRSRRLAWTVAGVATGLAFFLAVALAMLLPLKTVQPITLLVDRHTGYVQALDPQSPRRVVADEALTQSYLAQYVTAREGFDRAIVSANYRKVALLSAGSARSTYLAAMPASNPASPLSRYPAGTIVNARVKSVSRLEPGTALVRFDTQLEERGGAVGQVQPWIAVIRYRYTDAPMTVEDRLVNPLGFQVLNYRRDAEAPALERLPPAVATVSPATASRPASVPGPAWQQQAATTPAPGER